LPVVGEFDGNLANDGEMLRLYQSGVADVGIVPAYQVDHVNYGDSGDWPGRPDGEGATLYRVHPAGYGNEPGNWQSSAVGITPGRPAVRLDKSPPSIPSGAAALGTVTPSNAITLTWNASIDSQSFVDHYLVYRDSNLPVAVTGTSYVDTDITATTTYSYRISAVNRDGYESHLCDAVTAQIPGIVSYSTPEGRIEIVFSEPLNPASAGLASNYSINGVPPTGVALASGNSKVVLTTNAFDSTTLVSSSAAAKVTVPTASLGTTWTSTGYNDSTWNPATAAVGFEPTLANEAEPNNATTTANSAARNFVSSTGDVYFLGLTGTAESTGNGEDWFKLGTMQAGDVLTISGSGSPSVRGTATDLRLELWRSGAAITSDENAGPGADPLISRYLVTAEDTYYVKIVRASPTTGGTYALNLWLENAGAAPSTDATLTLETESNDLQSAANNASASWRRVRYRSSTEGTISTTGDADYYSYAFTAGDLVTVNVDSTSTLDAKVTLLDSSGTVVAVEDGSSGFSSPYDVDAPVYCYIVPTSGTYYVKVESSGSTTGTYNADVYLASSTPPAMFSGLVGTNIQSQMLGVNSSAYLRIPFTVSDPTAFSKLLLRVKYDDGFVAYLNGTEVARRNVPSTTVWNSTASTGRTDVAAMATEEIDITAFLSALTTGANVLAFQVLNSSSSDTDLMIVPELVGTQVGAHTTVTMSNLATASGDEIASPVQLSFDYAPRGSGTILREYWTGLSSSIYVADLTNSAKYPTDATGKSYLTTLEAPYNWTDYYGTRIRGYIYPPTTGYYTFWIAGEDTCELWLSTDDDPANKQKIAFVGGINTNAYRAWTLATSQVSSQISLAAGRRYYLEILQRDLNGNDSCSVRWQLPDGTWENADYNTPIPGLRLSPYDAAPDTTAPSTPQNLAARSTDNNTTVTLSWDAAYDPDYNVAAYRIYRDGVLYATVNAPATSYVDRDVSPAARHRYQVSAVNASNYESGTSRALTVAPLGATIGAYTQTTVQVVFSEAVEKTSAELLSNYSIPGVTITAAHLEADSLMVTLTTSTTLALNSNYTATVNGVRTLAGAVAASNLQQTFRVGGAVLREYWLNIGAGTAVSDLTGNAAFPNNPTGRDYRIVGFESPANWTTNYGERDRAYLVPAVSGNYTFWIASDDTSTLYLSPSADPNAKTTIAYLSSASGSRNWSFASAQQRSNTISLVAGQKYYLEALMKQAAGNSALAVAWLRPDAVSSLTATYSSLSTSLVRNGTSVTATRAGHGFSVGQMVTISGAAQTDYNGTFAITAITGDTFSYTISGTPVSPATGSVLVTPYGITRSGTTTIVYRPNHGYVNGDWVAIRGAAQTEYNGDFRVSDVTLNSFTITLATGAVPASPATGTMTIGRIEVIPARYLMPYSLISNLGPWCTGTVDDKGTTDNTPSLKGTVSDGSGSVTVCVGGVYYAATNNGNTTWDLPAGAIQTPLADGTYPVSVCIADSLGRLGFDTTTDELIVDSVLPTAQVVAVASGMSSTSVDQVQIVFSEPVTGFGISDLRFSRAGGTDLLTGAESLTTTDHITFTLSGLPAQTALETPYTLTLLGTGSNIEDAGGNEPPVDASATWTIHTIPPVVTVGSVQPSPRNSAVSQIQIVFDEWVDGLDLGDLQLTRNGGANLLTPAQTVTTSDHLTWTLSGLAPITAATGNYLLTVAGATSGVHDAAGNLLQAGGSTAWTVDAEAPTGALAAVIPTLRNSAITELAITFSEAVQGFSRDKLTLTRNSGSNLLTTSQTLTTTDNIHWTLGNLTSLTGTSGSYTIALNASGVTDGVGNALGAVTPVSWNVDTTAPTATVSTVTPNPRDTAVSSLVITFTEAVQGFGISKLSLTCNGGANLLTASQTLTTSDNLVWTLGNLSGITNAAGNYTLTVATTGVTDAAGNTLANSASSSWSMVISDLDADGNGTADALTDGILILRYLFAPSGNWSFSDAVGVGAARSTREAIRTYLNAGRTLGLDADGNGTADALTDGILILRYLFAPTGNWSFIDAVGAGATRTTREAIRTFLHKYNPAYSKSLSGLSSVPASSGLAAAVDADAAMLAVDPTAAEKATGEVASVPAYDAVLEQWTSSSDDTSTALVDSSTGLKTEADPAAEESVFGTDLDQWCFQSPGGLL
jgi:fibronectin type 3 domain-containing protein